MLIVHHLVLQGYGHCDILDDWGWEGEHTDSKDVHGHTHTHTQPHHVLPILPSVCHTVHFCKTVKTNDRVLYRRYVSGVMAALYGTYVQGNPEQLKYLTTPSNMPVPVTRMQVDVNC